jgi:hypothetical protein
MEMVLLIAFLASAVISIFSVFIYTPNIFKGVTIIHSHDDIKKLWKEKDFFPIANFVLFVLFVFLVVLVGVHCFT